MRLLLPIRDLIEVMQGALASFSKGSVQQPVRTVLQVAPNRDFFAVMPAHAPGLPALGAKLVSVFGENGARNLPTHLATILLFDPETGALLAVMDGRYITEVRTAAVSAVAVRFLARREAKTLAILGSGVQARSHLDALPLVRDFDEIRCWSPTPEHLRRFVAEADSTVLRASDSAEAAVRGADVVVLVTASTEPAIESGWVQEGACVISVGACRPNQREMDPELVARASVVVDSRASALAESGDIVLGIVEDLFSPHHIVAELGEVACDPALGRTTESETIVFKSLGLAIEDLAAAEFAYRRAKAQGRGVELV